MLRFNSMNFQNFGSFQGEHSFDFAHKGVHLITAQNRDLEGDSRYAGKYSVGSGKSTLTSVPFYALYGNTTKRINKDKIINKETGKDLKAALQFSVNDTNYLVERFRKHKQGKNGLFFYESIGGEWVDQTKSDIASTQQTINDVILINEETFLKTVLLSREDLQQFLDYTPAERWKIFESIIQLDKLKKYQDIVSKKKKNFQQELGRLKSEIHATNSLIAHITSEKEEALETTKLDIETLEAEIDELKNQSALIDDGNINDFIVKVKEGIKLAKEIRTFIKKQEYDMSCVTTLKKQLKKRETSLITYADEIEETKENLAALEPITCHNCGVIQNTESYENQKKQLQNHCDTQNKYKTEAEEAIKYLKKELKSSILEYKQATKIRESLEKEMDDLNLSAESQVSIWTSGDGKWIDEIKNIYDNILNKEAELQKIQNNQAPIKKMESNLVIKEKELRALQKEKKKVDAVTKELDYLDGALNIKNENSIKQYAVSTIMPVFNELMRQNLDQVFDDQLTLILDLIFNETIIFNGQQYNYHELSTGEKVKVNLSVNFAIFDAMRLNVMNSGIMFLDEIYTNIDVPSISSFTNLIKNKYAAESAVYTITHQSDAIEYLDPETITTIIKENDRSRIEVQGGIV